MANSILSAKVKRILSNPQQCRTLGRTLMELDDKRKCDLEDTSVKEIHTGIRAIARSLQSGVQKLDPQFEGDLFGTGSFYDRLKVGVVDEFDFMLQLKSLSGDNDLTFLSSEPGFANILITGDQFGKWPTTVYCLTHKVIANTETRKDCGSRCENTVKVLDASAVQDQFRALTDKVLKGMTLPTNWEHGGFLRPRFGGFRKHGPATLYQFVWMAPDGHAEIKVNMDMTLSIKLPTPTNTKPFQFDIFQRFPETNTSAQEIANYIMKDPGLAIIPLYSNFMIATGKADKKYSWKVSCSRVEQLFISSFSDASLLKTLIRVLKIIRDDHLTYHRRKTKRSKRKHKTKRRQNKSDDDVDREGGMDIDQLLELFTTLTTDVDDDSLSALASIIGSRDDQTVNTHDDEHDTKALGDSTETNNLTDNGAAEISDQSDQTSVEVQLGDTPRINTTTGDDLSGSNPSKDIATADSCTMIKESECMVQRERESVDTLDNDTQTDCKQTQHHGFENTTVRGDGKTSTTRVTEEICVATRSGAQKHELNQQANNAKIADNEPTVEPLSNLLENQTQNAATTDDITQSNSSSPSFLETKGDSPKVSLPDDTGTSLKSLAVSVPLTKLPVQHEGDNTDLTEVEELTALEYQTKFQAGHTKYQKYDIGQERVTQEPGSGEYYGARQYVSSVEIKFMAMNFVLRPASFPEIFKSDAEPESLAEYVLSSLENFRNIFGSGESTRSLYFPSPACTPLSPEKRRRVVNQIDTIIKDLEKEATKHDKDEEEYV